MDYLIRVSKLTKYGDTQQYEYLFATTVRSAPKTQRVWKELISKFPPPEYQVTVECVTQV